MSYVVWLGLGLGHRHDSKVCFSFEKVTFCFSKVSQAGCDVLLLQEVRLHGDRSGSQALFLQRLMPHFHWLAARLADQAEKPPDSYWTGWEGEGQQFILDYGHQGWVAWHVFEAYQPGYKLS